MVYRRTEKTERRLAEVRERVVSAALAVAAEHGFEATSMSAVAERADLSAGGIYRHFPSKGALLTEVFKRASGHELDVLASVAAVEGGPGQRLARVIEIFARRALDGRRLAYALIAEPVDPAVDAARLEYRRRYRDLFAGLVREGVAAGEFPAQDAELTGAALVGAVAECLVGPLAPDRARGDDGPLIAAVTTLALNLTGVSAHVG
ncbi:AcrR family transcriptional regulator [Streptosporangium album]|uniref:AcrR family transcriptional regulator n=1 Tax=Streptosporangium album TaxID=47479 RepID=A0A7W7RZ51_9ACTN|nr:TetR/AcrR family transcriptional regulator [Streptosporangium album]MBB4940944.1 AcrR family transcriptional regulator [Streptosporangium album]